MASLFSTEWIVDLAKAWNADRQMEEFLFANSFNANIAYGFTGEDKPKAVMVVEDGKVKSAGQYTNQLLDWDLRASDESWQGWLKNGLGMTNLGSVMASGKLVFNKGDYHKMIRNPVLGKAFLRHLELMQTIKTD